MKSSVFGDIRGHKIKYRQLPQNQRKRKDARKELLRGQHWALMKMLKDASRLQYASESSPGISLQSLRWVLFPTQGVLPWAPHTRLLICRPESSQADHSDQAIQPPKHRKKRAINKNPSNHKATSSSPSGLESNGPTQAVTTCGNLSHFCTAKKRKRRKRKRPQTHQKCLWCKRDWKSKPEEFV